MTWAKHSCLPIKNSQFLSLEDPFSCRALYPTPIYKPKVSLAYIVDELSHLVYLMVLFISSSFSSFFSWFSHKAFFCCVDLSVLLISSGFKLSLLS